MNCLHFGQKSIGWYFDFLGCAYPYFSFLLWDSPCNTIYKFLYCVIYICIIIMSVQVTVLACICIDKQADKYVFCSKVIQNQTILVTHCWKYSGCTVLSSNVRMNVQGHLITSPHCHKQWIFTSAVSTCMPWLTIACTASPNVWVVTSGLSYQTLQSLLHFIWDVCYM